MLETGSGRGMFSPVLVRALILARLFLRTDTAVKQSQAFARAQWAYTHLDKPNYTMSHPKLPYGRATNVRLSVYHCDMIRFSAAYSHGAARDDTIDCWPWQIIAWMPKEFRSSHCWLLLVLGFKSMYFVWAVKRKSGILGIFKLCSRTPNFVHSIF